MAALNATKDFKFELSKPRRFNTSMKFNYFFATQYKQCYIYFGIKSGTSVAESDNQTCESRGSSITLVEGVDKEESYIWSPMPQLNRQLQVRENVKGSMQLCGGYAHGEEIKMIGIINVPEYRSGGYRSKGYYQNSARVECWTISLTTPTQYEVWSQSSLPVSCSSWHGLLSVQHCHQYIIFFYSSLTTIINESNQHTVTLIHISLNRHVSCAVIGTNMFIVSGDKMAKVENFGDLLEAYDDKIIRNISVSFDLNLPHANGTLFVVQDTLCILGGCDDDYEPFSDIYQFDQDMQEWIHCGFSTVSRFGASVVVFTDRNNKKAVFVAGGFKGDDMPCSIIEKLSVIVKSN